MNVCKYLPVINDKKYCKFEKEINITNAQIIEMSLLLEIIKTNHNNRSTIF